MVKVFTSVSEHLQLFDPKLISLVYTLTPSLKQIFTQNRVSLSEFVGPLVLPRENYSSNSMYRDGQRKSMEN